MKKTLAVAIICLFIYSCKSDDSTTTPKTKNPTGLKPNSASAIEAIDEADFDDSLFVANPSTGSNSTPTLPASFALDIPPIVSQGETDKCAAFSSAYYIIGLYNGVKSSTPNLDKVGSPDFAYGQYKKINNQGCSGDAGGALFFNDGSTVGMANILQDYGACSWNQLPFTNNKECSVISSQNISQAVVNKIADFRRVDKKEYRNARELKSLIFGGFPLWFGVSVEDNWQNIGTSVWKSSTGTGGGHAMVIVGWDDAKGAFKVANSWGADWGDKGFGWVDYAYLPTLLDELGGMISILYPSKDQLETFGNLSPGSCARANWGDIVVDNKRSEEISVEITGSGTNPYKNKATDPTEAGDSQIYSGIPAGNVSVKVFNAGKTTVLNTYTVTVVKCNQVKVTVN